MKCEPITLTSPGCASGAKLETDANLAEDSSPTRAKVCSRHVLPGGLKTEWLVKTRFLYSLLLAGVLLIGGCAEGRLYPVRGPFSTQSPLPVFTAKMSGGFHSGNMTVNLSSGEKGMGRWQWAKPESPSAEKFGANTSTSENLASVWGAVYGQDFYVSHVLGRLMARAEITGDRGTRLQIEMYRPVGEGGDVPVNFRGVARDNQGNIYKVAF